MLHRDAELASLNRIYIGSGFSAVVIHGCGRIGKTSLAAAFISDKPAIYFSASESGMSDNMDILNRAAAAVTNGVCYENLSQAVAEICGLAERRRLILVVDNCDTLSASGFTALVTSELRDTLLGSELMLVLITSLPSYAREFTLSADKFGFPITLIELTPLNFYESLDFISSYSPEDAAAAYAITGGVPGYLRMFSTKSFRDSITSLFLKKSSSLLREPEIILRREVREPSLYSAALRCIAMGLNKNSQISKRFGLPSSASTAYLNNLISFGLVRKMTPLLDPSSKRTVYEITNGLFRFWYTFMPDVIELVELERTDRAFVRINSGMDAFTERAFADICRTWLLRENAAGRLNTHLRANASNSMTDIDRFRQWLLSEGGESQAETPTGQMQTGRWWDNTDKLDILALKDESGDGAVLALCRWSNEKSIEDDLRALQRVSAKLGFLNSREYLFVRSEEQMKSAGTFSSGAAIVRFEDML